MVATSERRTTSRSKKAADKAGSKNQFKTPAPERKPVVLDGAKAKNPHFLIDRAVHTAAAAKAAEDGVRLSEVMRQGLEQYGAGRPETEGSVLDRLPEDAMTSLLDLYSTGDSTRVNAYLAALYRAGWPLRTLANSLSEGSGKSMTRQAISQRVLKAPEELPEDLPAVPALGFRRMSQRIVRRPKEAAVDASFRIKDEHYQNASARAKAEGAMVSSVLEDILRRYSEGKFEVRLPAVEADSDAADN